MSTLTTNLKLTVPVVDQVPWDADVNANWNILDAAVGMFTAIPNMTGIWKNSTSYLVGQATIDTTDSGIWICMLTHTSPAVPTTFAEDRAANPGRWSLSTTSGLYLPLSGGTIAGSLIIAGPLDVSGNIDATGEMRANGEIHSTTSFRITNSGALFTSNDTFTQIYFDDTISRLTYFRAANTLEFIRGYDNVTLVSFGGDGTNVFAGTLKVIGALETDNTLFVRGGTVFWGAADQAKLFTDSTSQTFIQMNINYFWELDWVSGDLHWNIGAVNVFTIRQSDGMVGNNVNSVFGYGPYITVSDDRTKAKTWPTIIGLSEIMQVDPIMFNRKADGRDEIGFSAQQVQKVLPQAVLNVGGKQEVLGVSLDPIVAALVNATKELSTRIVALETKA